MKKIVFFILVSVWLSSQMFAENKLVMTEYDYDSYPEISADFYLVDSSFTPLSFTSQDFLATDNGRELAISSLVDGSKDKNVTSHHVILFDASLSSVGGASSMLSQAKELAIDYISRLDSTDEHITVITFSDIADLIIDRTLDYDKASTLISDISYDPNSKLDVALKFPSTGLLDYLERYDEEKVNVMLLTGNFQKMDQGVLSSLNERDVTLNTAFFIRDINPVLKSLTEGTSGFYVDNIRDKEKGTEIVTSSILNSRGFTPYKVILNDILNCDTYHEFKIELYDTLTTSTEFEILDALRPLLESTPSYLSFSSVLPETTKDLEVSVKAINSEIFIDSIRLENSYNGIFEIVDGKVDQTIAIGQNQSHNLTVRFSPVDSAIVFTKLLIYSNACDGNEILVTGGFPNTPPNEETITVLAPQCDQTLIAGDVFTIKWTGVLPKDVIQLEYSTDSGEVWDTLATNVTDLEYEWSVPYTLSDQCLIRAIQLWPNNIGRTLDLTHETPLGMGTFSRDGSIVLTASDDNIVRMWNSNTGSLVREFEAGAEGHTGRVTDIIFSPDEKLVISAGVDSKIIIWDAETGEIVDRLLGHNQEVRDLEIGHNGILISVSRRNTNSKVILWDIDNATMLREYNDLSKPISEKWLLESIEVHPINNEFITSGLTGLVHVYEIDPDNTELVPINTFDTKVLGQQNTYAKFATVSPDGKQIFVSENLSVNKPGIMFDYETGDLLFSIYHPSNTPINSAEFFYSDDSKWMITSAEDKLAILWDAETGDSLAVFKEHTGNVTHAEFNFDGSRVLTTSWDFSAKIWNLKERDLQMDTTDCEFSISTALIESEDLSVGEAIVRQTIDTVFSSFIFNNSDFAYDIFDIRIQGENDDEFEIISGWAPYEISGKAYESINIAFTPQASGLRTAELVVEFPGNSITVSLSGIGVDPGIRQITEIVDFGEVEIGDYLTFNAIELIENTSGEDVVIDSIAITGIERDFFSYANLDIPSALTQSQILTSDIRFTPLEISTFAGTMRIYHSAPSSPTNILLTGVGIPQKIDSLKISLGSDIANPGEIVSIPLSVDMSTLDVSQSDLGKLVFDLEFDPTILEPLANYPNDSFDSEKRVISVELPLSGQLIESGVLANLDFRVALGMDSISRLMIKNLSYIGDYKLMVEAANGEVKINGLCEEGGHRLFDGRGILRIGDIAPNPVISNSEVTIDLAESTHTNISIMDYQGKIVGSLRDDFMTKGSHVIDININSLPQGMYHLIVRTRYDLVRSSFVVRK